MPQKYVYPIPIMAVQLIETDPVTKILHKNIYLKYGH